MILAIDQGSSKTQALIGDENGKILGCGMAEGACHFMVGLEKSMNAVRKAAEGALASAGLTKDCITNVSAGMAGANWPDEFELLSNGLNELFGVQNSTVYNDCVPALYAGTDCPDAVILCAGTSFNSAVIKDRKYTWIYNNYIEKDDQGGKSLAERALRCVFQSETCVGMPTSMTQRALDFFGYQDIQSLVIDFDRGVLPKRVKDFAIIVDEEAMKGDQAALNVQYEFGVSVSRYAVGAMKRFGMLDRRVDIVLSGGIFKSESPVLADAIRASVHRVAPLAKIVESVYEPVVGAYLLALDESIRPRVEESAREKSLVRFGKER